MTPMSTDQNQNGVLSVTSVSSVATLLPLPSLPIAVRVATMEDLAFIDSLQKKQSRAVGFMPTKQLEGKIAKAEILVAWAPRPCSVAEGDGITSGALVPRNEERVGYLIGCDRYFKRDDVGIIYAINIVAGHQRGLIGATLLKAQFERSAYGCRLYCCWCAQDLAANRFWESMGFVPLAFRTGSPTKGASAIGTRAPRTHIFWQKRIRANDTSTPWWFPSKTDGGALREDRLVLPIPPPLRWDDEMPVMLPVGTAEAEGEETAARKPRTRRSMQAPPSQARQAIAGSRLRFGAADADPSATLPAAQRRENKKADPAMIAKARELRDRWLEHVNENPTAAVVGKYDVSRRIEATTLPLLTAA